MRKKEITIDPDSERDLLDDINYYDVKCKHARPDTVTGYRDMKREKIKELITQKHAYAICGGGGKRYHTRTPDGRQIYATRIEDLYDKLYDYYYGDNGKTLEELFAPYIAWKTELRNPQGGTVKRETNIFKKYIAGSELGSTKIKEIKASDIEKFFTGYSERLKRHDISNIKSIINGIYDYAVARDIVPVNIARQYNTRTIKTQAQTNKYKTYTDDDRAAILAALEKSDNIYDLAISFMFCLCCRIGELRGLKWCDLSQDGARILICREVVLRYDADGKGHYVTVDHTKTGHDSGVRELPLTDRARGILERVRKKYGDSGAYIFCSRGGKFLYETPFGQHLKKACETAGVEYRSSHKTRFWAVSSLASNGASAQDLMEIAGWSTTQTALHYIRMNAAGKRTADLFDSAID